MSNMALSQNLTTKFSTKGYINLEPKIITKSLCQFKKGKEVEVIAYFNFDWWKVKYNGCIGFVTSSALLLNNDMNNLKIKKLKDDEIELQESVRIKDSIRLDKLHLDSIILINKRK